MWVKICGITNLADGEAAVASGADALGFVFAPSKRRIEPALAREIIWRLPAEVEKIGVFVEETLSRVREIAAYCGLTGLQLHGEETPEYLTYLKDYDLIKSFRMNSQTDFVKIKDYIVQSSVNRILLDSFVPGQWGGTGKTFSWESLADCNWGGIQVIIAGGLNPENVSEAIRLGKPAGVDVSSGVEKEPGRKDLVLLRKFIERAKGGLC
ncbi:MAG: phosphoribosylanthranilate isomerase [Clostridia bacterium]|jgi:phosphoribosylanthranilate isomerase|nr:phosphoribosylanthranilate isomerase [Clostridia bacterium]